MKPPIREILATKDIKERRKLVNAWFNNYMQNRGRLDTKIVIANEDEDFWRYYEDEMSALLED